MNTATTARIVRWAIWLISFIAAGSLKPIFFPEGGWRYAIGGISLILVGAVLGEIIERWMVSKNAKKGVSDN